MDIAIAVLLRPLTLLLLLGTAVLVARALRPAFPAGRVRDVLYRKHALLAANEIERRDWTAPVACFVGSALLFAWIYWLARDVI